MQTQIRPELQKIVYNKEVLRDDSRSLLELGLRHGAKLESEHQLVRRFEVSRATVRKGLEVLAEKGLITTRMWKTADSTRIAPTSLWTTVDKSPLEVRLCKLLPRGRLRDQAV